MTDLDFDPTIPPARGRKRVPVDMYYVRDLDESDVAQMYDEVGSIPKTIQKIRNSHHLLAQALARGVKETDAALMTGYQIATISNLKRDPAFRQLLEYYTAETKQVQSDMLARLRAMGFDTMEILHEKLLAGELAPNQILDLGKMILDRTGHGPKSTVDHNYGIDGKTLEMLKSAVDAASTGKIIDVQVSKEPEIGDSIKPSRVAEEGHVLQFPSQRDGVAAEGGETPEEDFTVGSYK